MTGIEQLLVKTANATAQAFMGMCAVVDRGVVETAREEALEDEERRLREKWQIRRKLIHYGCE
jgi:hypothetical protein